jgi:hypothetical protein
VNDAIFDYRALAELVDEARSLLELVTAGRAADKEHPQVVLPASEILQRARDAKADGYPTRSMGGGGGSGVALGLADVVTADWVEHRDCPGGEGIGCSKCSDGFVYRPAELTRSSAVDLVNRVRQAVTELRRASAAMHKASSHEGKASPPPDDDLWCQNHLKHGMFEPRAPKRALCRWCYDFRLANSLDAPKDLLLRRARGERITAQTIDKTLGQFANRTGRRKRRRAS